MEKQLNIFSLYILIPLCCIGINTFAQTNNYQITLKHAIHGDSLAQHQLAVIYFEGTEVTTNYDSAFYWFNKATIAGNKNSKLFLSYLYYTGKGVDKDTLKASFWFDKSLIRKNPEEIVKIADFYFVKLPGKNIPFALYILEQMSKRGNDEVQLKLGDLYYKGSSGVTKDLRKAFYNYHQCAKNGNSTAWFMIAYMYQEGLGVTARNDSAVYWYRKGAEHDITESQVNLGILLYILGGKEDMQEAAAWIHKAKESGSENAAAIWEEFNLSDYIEK